jgi:hypothetical protein
MRRWKIEPEKEEPCGSLGKDARTEGLLFFEKGNIVPKPWEEEE